MANEWSQPGAPPGPLFVGKKERDFAKQVTDEIVEKIVGQRILYFSIDMESTNFHPLYGEAITKVFLPPVHVHVLVEYEGSTTTSEQFGVDKLDTAKIHFHNRRLTEDQDLFVRVGDFIQYDNKNYEIVELTSPRYIFGQDAGLDGHKVEVIASVRKARAGLFEGMP
jgi:hypothetical protein